MAVPTIFGVLASQGSGAAAGASFVGAADYGWSGASQAVAFPAGAAEGDKCLIAMAAQGASNEDTATISGGSGGWNKESALLVGNMSCVFEKNLEAGDLGGVTINTPNLTAIRGTVAVILVYRGASTAAAQNLTTASSGTSLTVTGFTKSANFKAAVCIAFQRGDTAGNFAPPGTFTERGSYGSIAVTPDWRSRGADVLNPANYTNGSAIPYTGFSASTTAKGVWVYELT